MHNSKLLRLHSKISSPSYTFPPPYPLFPHSGYEATTTLHVTHMYTVLYHGRGISLEKRLPTWRIFLRLMHLPLTTVSWLRETLYRVLCFAVTKTAQLFFHRSLRSHSTYMEHRVVSWAAARTLYARCICTDRNYVV